MPTWPRTVAHQLGHAANYLIARRVAVGVVHALEVVDVQRHHRERRTRGLQVLDRILRAAPVAQARQRVGDAGQVQLAEHLMQGGKAPAHRAF
ncbi:hypothetical protein G6F68_020533 [Rhizopus microsporus]|nr:hypothetical protein G6F68_020533 [Rhizopus microsporus]